MCDSVYIGLVFACPKGEADEDCPLRELRELPIEGRIDKWNGMSEKEKREIITHHKECVNRIRIF